MRYLPLVLAALLLIPTASAQEYPTDKGSLLLDGSLNFSRVGLSDDEGRENHYTQLEISPSLSYFVTSNLAVGANLQYVRYSFDGDASSVGGLGPQIAYFFGRPASTILPFVAATATYLESDSGSGLRGDLAGGAVFMIARNVGVNAEGFYQALSFKEDSGRGDFNESRFGLRGGVTVFVF